MTVLKIPKPSMNIGIGDIPNTRLREIFSMVRHSNQDAVGEEKFERLIDATESLSEPRDAEAMFILIAAGRLGMRAGEICHMKCDWVDFDRRVIEIPNHEPCSCGYCLKQAKQSVAHNSSLNTESDSDIESVLENRWKPKTDSSIRSIPFDFNDRVESTVICFFELFDEYERSRVTVNRRVNKVAEIAGINDRIYPHALRATAASYHAYEGLPAPALQSLFGWSKLETAQKYVRLSGGKTQKALNEIHDS